MINFMVSPLMPPFVLHFSGYFKTTLHIAAAIGGRARQRQKHADFDFFCEAGLKRSCRKAKGQ